MEGFKFRKLDIWCRNGICVRCHFLFVLRVANFYSLHHLADPRLKAVGLLLGYECTEQLHQQLFDILCWRYTKPSVLADLPSDLEGEVQSFAQLQGFCRSVSWIDRQGHLAH